LSFRAKREARSRGICISTLFLLLALPACRSDAKVHNAAKDSVVATLAPEPPPTGMPPAFVSAQVKRGQQIYFTQCLRCHTADRFTGGQFAKIWKGRRVYDLYDLLASTMPQDSPGSLSTDQYLDLVAYLLQLNGAVPGERKLTADVDTLKKMRVGVTRSSE
jgi:mono/diheme cytochrome c family protein